MVVEEAVAVVPVEEAAAVAVAVVVAGSGVRFQGVLGGVGDGSALSCTFQRSRYTGYLGVVCGLGWWGGAGGSGRENGGLGLVRTAWMGARQQWLRLSR